MENLRVESLTDMTERKTPQRVLFTYYQGDINSVVDEHFARALKKASLPKDLSIKASSSPKEQPGSNKPRSRSKVVRPGLCAGLLYLVHRQRDHSEIFLGIDRHALICVLTF